MSQEDKKKINTVPPLGPDYQKLHKRKAGAHPHKNTKRQKTRQKIKRIQKALEEY